MKNVEDEAKKAVKETIEESSNLKIPLYQRRKGKEYHASGTWEVSKTERRIIEGFGYVFFFGVFIGLVLLPTCCCDPQE